MSQAHSTNTDNKTHINDANIAPMIGEDEYIMSSSSADIGKIAMGDSPPLKPANVLQLQRQMGNQFTTKLVSRQPKSQSDAVSTFAGLRMVSGQSTPYTPIQRADVISAGDREDSESDVEMYDGDEDIDLTKEEKIERALNDLEKIGPTVFDRQTHAQEKRPVAKLLIDKVIASGESVLTDNQYDFLIQYSNINEQKQLADSKKASKLTDAIAQYNSEDAQKKRQADEELEHEYSYLSKAIDYAIQQGNGVGLMTGEQAFDIRQMYYKKGRFSRIEDVASSYNEYKKKLQAPEFAWILSPKNKTINDMGVAALAQIETHNKKLAMENKEKDPIGSTFSTLGTVSELASVGFSVQQGAQSITKIKESVSSVESAKGASLFGSASEAMESMTMWVIGKAFGAISIGVDLVKSFRHHKKRRDGYRAAMDRSGIDYKGNTDVKPVGKEDSQKYRLGRVAYYAWKKTSRAFITTIMKAALKFIKWISHAITLLTGGTSALVTESIALAADVARAARLVFEKVKGFGKLITGKRGLNRKLNATELVQLAKEGDDSAIKTIMDVFPFDAMNTIPKKAVKKVFGAGTMLPAPASEDELKKSFKSGYYHDPKVQKALINALANTMKSK